MRLRLKEWRERRLLTQRELAERIGVTTGTINRIERGVHQPRLATVRRLAEALGVDPDDLVEWGSGHGSVSESEDATPNG